MLDFNEELAKFQPCADLEEAEENIYGKELEEIKKNNTARLPPASVPEAHRSL